MSQATELIATQMAAGSNISNIWGKIIINAAAAPFYAKGDGVTVNTVAFQAAVDYAISIGKHEITLPAGTYLYGVLTNTSGITIVGDGVILNGTTPLKLTSLAAVKNITLSTVSPTSGEGADGDIWIKYIPNVPPTVTNLAINGALTVGTALIGTYVYVDSDGELESGTTYKWYTSASPIWGSATVIVGATTAIYTLQTADINKYIFFEVIPSDASSVGVAARVVSINIVGVSTLNVTFSGTLDSALWKQVTYKSNGATLQPTQALADINSSLMRLRLIAAGGGGSGGVGCYYQTTKVALPQVVNESRSYKTTVKLATGSEVTGFTNEVRITLATSVPSGSAVSGGSTEVVPAGNWALTLANQTAYLQGLASSINNNAAFAYVANTNYTLEMAFTKKSANVYDVLGKINGTTIVSALGVTISTPQYLYCVLEADTQSTAERTITFANLIVG